MEILWCGAYSRGRETLLRRLCETGGVLLTPEQFSHESERMLCDIGGDSVCLRAEVLTFGRLANRVFALAGGLSDPVLDEGGRLLALRLALAEVSGNLRLWGAASRRVSFLESLLTTIDELKCYCITPAILAEASENAGGQAADRFRDLSLILAAYERRLEGGAYDPRDTYTRLLAALRESGYAKGRHLYIDGFLSFTTQEALIVRHFAENAEDVVIALPGPPESGDDDRFLTSRRLSESLIRWAEDAHKPFKQTAAERSGFVSPALEHLAKHFISPAATAFTGETDAVRLILAPDTAAECRFIASDILRLAREQRVRYRDIAVLVPGYERCADILELTCGQYGIPLFSDETRGVTASPMYRLTVNALAAVSHGYSREHIFACLKTGLSCLGMDEVYELESYARLWNLRGAHWSADRDWRFHPDGFDGRFDEKSREKLARLNDMRRRVRDMLMPLRSDEPARAVRVFWERLSLRERLQARAERLTEQNERRMAMETVQLWDTYTEALLQCELALDGQKTELSEFSELYELTLSRYSVGVIPVSLDRLTAGDISRVRRRGARHVYIMGATAENVMRVPDAGGLLTDADRVLLEQMGAGASPGGESRAERELTNLYNAVTLAAESLTVTRPLTGGDEGGPARASLLQTALSALFNITERQTDPERDLTSAYSPALELAALGSGGGKWAVTVREALRIPAELPQETEDKLSSEAARALFGDEPVFSATRLNLLASCGFAHFARYGLRVSAPRDAGFNALDVGNFAHSVLEQTSKQLLGIGGFKNATAAQALLAADEAINGYKNVKIYPSDHSPRFIWQFDRLSRMVRNLAKNMYDELSVSDFSPSAFELELREPVRGKVDRLDVYERGDELYVRVVDYKTGKTAFSLTEVKHGLGMQMLLYLFAMTGGTNAAALMREYPGIKKIVPAGVLYWPARETLINAPRGASAEEIAQLSDGELRRSGLLLDDMDILRAMERTDRTQARYLPVKYKPDGSLEKSASVASSAELDALRKHTERVLQSMKRGLLRGEIACNPYSLSNRTACDYCDYAGACRFDPELDEPRRLPRETRESFWSGLTGN